MNNKIKKLLLISAAILFTACSACSETGWNGEEVRKIPRELRFEYFYSAVFGTNTTQTATSFDGTAEDAQTTGFYKPYKRTLDRLKNHPDWYPNGYYIDSASPRHSYRIVVTDIEYYTTEQNVNTLQSPETCFHVQVLENAVTGEQINRDAYILDTSGSPQYCQYGYSRLSVGQEYLIADACLPYLTEWRSFDDGYAYRAPYIFEIHEVDGVEYLYSCKDDVSTLDFKIEITDPAENAMYKDYRDWDIIDYMDKNGIENPTFGYKLRLDEFVKYRDDYNKDWNSAFEEEPGMDEIIKNASSVSMWTPEEDKIFLNKRDKD